MIGISHIKTLTGDSVKALALDGVPLGDIEEAAAGIRLRSDFLGNGVRAYDPITTNTHDFSFDLGDDVSDAQILAVGVDLKLQAFLSQIPGGVDIEQLDPTKMLDLVVGGVVQRNASGILGGCKTNAVQTMQLPSHAIARSYGIIALYSGTGVNWGTIRAGTSSFSANGYLLLMYGTIVYTRSINSSGVQVGNHMPTPNTINGVIMSVYHNDDTGEYTAKANNNVITSSLATNIRTGKTSVTEAAKKLSGTTQKHYYHGEILFKNPTVRLNTETILKDKFQAL